jgi:DeoR family deoxyribose operon repressor
MGESEVKRVILARREQRIGRLRRLVREQGALRLAEAALLLGVSPMTLRRDLAEGAPCAADLALLGGHVTAAPMAPAYPIAPSRYVLDREQKSRAGAKREAARHAARLVAEGDTVFIDCGTTLPHLVTALSAGMPLTIVCYALNIASLAAQRPNTQLLLLGGIFHPSSATFYAEDQVERLRRLGINIAFFSAGGAHVTRGASCSNFHEVAIKQAALAAAMRRHLVVDTAKLGRLKPAFFAPLSAFDSIITDARITSEARASFRAPPLDPAPG